MLRGTRQHRHHVKSDECYRNAEKLVCAILTTCPSDSEEVLLSALELHGPSQDAQADEDELELSTLGLQAERAIKMSIIIC